MRYPFVLNISDLMRRAGNDKRFALTEPVSALGIADPRLDPDAPIVVDVQLESLTDGVVVHGTVSVPWSDTCRRCLRQASGTTVSQINELYQFVVVDPEAFPIVGDQLDLAPMVRDAVLLDTPAAPVGRDGCAGLCPVCGVDRNDAQCTCSTEVVDPRWQALKSFRESVDQA